MKEADILATLSNLEMRRNFEVDQFETRIKALLSVVKDRMSSRGINKEIAPAAPAKYIDFTLDYDMNPQRNLRGNPKFPQMERTLLSYALAFGSDGMKKFVKWRDGKEYGRNVTPAHWYRNNLFQTKQEQLTLGRNQLYLFWPSYYLEHFAPEDEKTDAKVASKTMAQKNSKKNSTVVHNPKARSGRN